MPEHIGNVLPADFIVLQNPDTRELITRIKYDGTVEFGEGVTPDDAARHMWEALSGYILRGIASFMASQETPHAG